MNVNVAILGLGALGRALLVGMLTNDAPLRVTATVTNSSAAKAALWEGEDRVTAYAVETQPDANLVAVENADIVIAAVEPNDVMGVLAEVAPALKPGAIVVSVAAGLQTGAIERVVPETVSVVRALPNTAALVGKGLAGISAGSRASQADIDRVVALFETGGKVVVVDERDLEKLSAVSGSGPAYVFYVMDALTASARRLGFSEADARSLSEQTFLGTMQLLAESGKDPAELRAGTVKEGGSTMAALGVFDEAGVGEIFDRALAAAVRRSGEMAAEAAAS